MNWVGRWRTVRGILFGIKSTFPFLLSHPKPNLFPLIIWTHLLAPPLLRFAIIFQSPDTREEKLNPRLILTYLIPLNLLSALIPSPALLQPHPRLQQLFTPFIKAIQSGNIREYDERLEWAQPRLVGCNVYLVVERAREGCLRVLFKKA
jgi:hypothetical protein